MITCHIMINGRVEPLSMTLPAVPTIGSVIAKSADHKSEHYLVKCVEYVNRHDTVIYMFNHFLTKSVLSTLLMVSGIADNSTILTQ